MTSRNWPAILKWLHRRAQNVAVFLIATMFVCFLLQIFFRYFLNNPLGWTEEVTVLCWLWTILWGVSFVLSDEEEIRFDIVYGIVPQRVRRAFTIIAGVTLIVLFVISLPAAWQYVAFMKRERSAYLHVPFDYLYSIYVIFVVATIVRHGAMVFNAIRGKPEPNGDPSIVTSEHI